MKFCRLTREQFEALHHEFAQFLASQSIDQSQWEKMKDEQPSLVEEELDLFSDLIWEKTLKKLRYIENTSASKVFLFSIEENEMFLRILSCSNPSIDLATIKGWQCAMEHIGNTAIELMASKKKIGPDREKELFELIQQGCVLSEGERYRRLESFFKTTKK